MTTNIDLERLARKNNITIDYIIYKDELLKIPYKSNLSIIINMSSTGHAGTHWVSLYTKGKKIFYFDSFGAIPPEEVVVWFHDAKIIYNDYQIQHFSSEMCGQHSLGFLGLMQGKVVKGLLDDYSTTN